MKIQTSPKVDSLIAQHKNAVENFKVLNDWINRNVNNPEVDKVIFSNNCMIRKAYRELERTIRIQLGCFSIICDGKGHYNVALKINKIDEKKNPDNNN